MTASQKSSRLRMDARRKKGTGQRKQVPAVLHKPYPTDNTKYIEMPNRAKRRQDAHNRKVKGLRGLS